MKAKSKVKVMEKFEGEVKVESKQIGLQVGTRACTSSSQIPYYGNKLRELIYLSDICKC